MLYIKTTEDQSNTIYSNQFNEYYHSIHGAYNESMHVFIKSGLNHCKLESIKIFEVGFGTGLNALLTYQESLNRNLKIDYTAIELYPLDLKVTNQLNFSEFIEKENQGIFKKLHEVKWNEKTEIDRNFYLTKINADFTSFQFKENYDLIYFDAFAPDKQPDMWSHENFLKLYKALNINGILTTYSSKGLVKSNLRSAGFTVSRLAGPKGKRHILRAIKES